MDSGIRESTQRDAGKGTSSASERKQTKSQKATKASSLGPSGHRVKRRCPGNGEEAGENTHTPKKEK